MEKQLIKGINNIVKELKYINKHLKDKEMDENELIYSQEDAIEFIYDKLMIKCGKKYIKEILDYEEDYMRSVGIIEE